MPKLLLSEEHGQTARITRQETLAHVEGSWVSVVGSMGHCFVGNLQHKAHSTSLTGTGNGTYANSDWKILDSDHWTLGFLLDELMLVQLMVIEHHFHQFAVLGFEGLFHVEQLKRKEKI